MDVLLGLAVLCIVGLLVGSWGLSRVAREAIERGEGYHAAALRLRAALAKGPGLLSKTAVDSRNLWKARAEKAEAALSEAQRAGERLYREGIDRAVENQQRSERAREEAQRERDEARTWRASAVKYGDKVTAERDRLRTALEAVETIAARPSDDPLSDMVAADIRATVRAALSPASPPGAAPRHGIDCPKAPHVGTGHQHGEEDDAPFNDDGVDYCGRCHHCLSPAESAAALSALQTRAAAAPRTMHAMTTGWPGLPSNDIATFCGVCGVMADDLTDDPDEVTCLRCLQGIARSARAPAAAPVVGPGGEGAGTHAGAVAQAVEWRKMFEMQRGRVKAARLETLEEAAGLVEARARSARSRHGLVGCFFPEAEALDAAAQDLRSLASQPSAPATSPESAGPQPDAPERPRLVLAPAESPEASDLCARCGAARREHLATPPHRRLARENRDSPLEEACPGFAPLPAGPQPGDMCARCGLTRGNHAEIGCVAFVERASAKGGGR